MNMLEAMAENETAKQSRIERMRQLIDEDDLEEGHIEADRLLCESLRDHGETELVELWLRIRRCYI